MNDLQWPWVTCRNIQWHEASRGLSATAELLVSVSSHGTLLLSFAVNSTVSCLYCFTNGVYAVESSGGCSRIRLWNGMATCDDVLTSPPMTSGNNSPLVAAWVWQRPSASERGPWTTPHDHTHTVAGYRRLLSLLLLLCNTATVALGHRADNASVAPRPRNRLTIVGIRVHRSGRPLHVLYRTTCPLQPDSLV